MMSASDSERVGERPWRSGRGSDHPQCGRYRVRPPPLRGRGDGAQQTSVDPNIESQSIGLLASLLSGYRLWDSGESLIARFAGTFAYCTLFVCLPHEPTFQVERRKPSAVMAGGV